MTHLSLFNCSMFGFWSETRRCLRYFRNVPGYSLCQKKKNNPAVSVPSEYTVVFQSVYSVQMSRAKCHGCTYLLMNRSFSVSAILPFAALDRSLLYLWIYCALISCCSLLPFRFPQQLCFHTVQRAFYRRKKKNWIPLNLFLYHSLKICCRRHWQRKRRCLNLCTSPWDLGFCFHDFMANILYGQYLSVDNFVLMSMYFKKIKKPV